jgi:regulator of protease activity HflC (stomatin/prohibitin superfamily)
MVDLGVSIMTRINRVPTADIGGPGDLVQSLTVDDTTRWDAHIQSISEEALLDSFSKLLASEFYLPEKRKEAMEKAVLRIRPRLAKVGIMLESVLIHNFNYQRSEIEDAISAKNIQIKEKELNKALSRLAKVDAELSESEAKLRADMDIERTKGEQLALRIRSEAALKEAENKAKGDELVALAESKVKSDSAQLLTDQKAASRLIAEQMAPLLASLKGGVVSDIDPYNLNDWAVRFGIEKGNSQN